MARWSWGVSSVRHRLKRWLFGLLGKDPDGILVVFASGAGSEHLTDEMRRLVPDRRVVFVEDDYSVLRPYRIAQAAVLFDGDPAQRGRRWRAFLKAPRRILAFHPNRDRHQLSLRQPLASLLFVIGVPLDRIFLRPSWWFGGEPTTRPDTVDLRPGQPARGLRRVGILTPYLPYPLSHGGAVRIFNLLREAARHFDVTLFAFIEEDLHDLGPLPGLCEKIILVRKPRYREPRWSTLHPPEVGEYESPAMRRALAQNPVDLLQVEYTQLARYPGHVLVEHDVTFDLQRQVEAREPSLIHRWNRWRWERFELAAVLRFAATVVMSEKDRDLLGTGTVIPNGVDLDRYQPFPEPAGRRLLFIGSFRHFPNVTGLRWFLDHVWPLLPTDIELEIVAGPGSAIYWDMPPLDRVRRHDFVEDVRPLYQRANVVIVPTLVSAGTNVKVLEAMAMERAVVSTPSGCGGLDLVHGESVWIAAQPSDFAQGITTLLDDSPRRHQIARRSRQLAVDRFGWQAIGEVQRQLWERL